MNTKEKLVLLSNKFDKAQYDKVAIHPCQSWEYGLFLESLGYKVLRLAILKKDRIAAVFQIYLAGISNLEYKIGHAPKSILPSVAMLNKLKTVLTDEKVIFLRIEPYESSLSRNIPKSNILTKSPDSLTLNYTIKIDLTRPAMKIFEDLKPKTKYNIRLAQKKGIQIKEMTGEEGFNIFSKLFFATCIRKKFYSHNINYQQKLFESLKNKISHILVAFYRNRPVAAYHLFIFNIGAYFPFGGSDYSSRKYMATNLLLWESLLFSKKAGAEYLDFYETLAPDYDLNHPWVGLTRFAQGYGGRFVKFIDNYDLIINQSLYKDYSDLISNSHKIVSSVMKKGAKSSMGHFETGK